MELATLKRMSDQAKLQEYLVPDYADNNTEMFLLSRELACFALFDSSPTLQESKASGLSYFLGTQVFVWVPTSPLTSERYKSTITRQLIELNISRIHLFVRRNITDDWYDIGQGYISGIGEINSYIHEIHIRLDAELTEPLWVCLGGHSGWSLAVNGDEIQAPTIELALESIRAAWSHPTVDLEISRYADGALIALADNSVATVSFWNGRAEYVSGIAQLLSSANSTHIFRRSNNHDHEVSVTQLISREEALSIMEGFVLNGNTLGLSRLPNPA